MPVQLPRVQRGKAPAPTRTPTTQVQAPDAARGFQQVSQTIQQSGQQIAKAFEQKQQDYLDTKKNELDNKFSRWARDRINGRPADPDSGREAIRGLRHLEGDPTEQYNKFDEELDQKREELIGELNVSDRGRTIIERALLRRTNQFRNQTSVYYGQQYEKYETEVDNAKVQQEKDLTDEHAMFIDAQDETTLAPFEDSLGTISSVHARRSVKRGSGEYVPEDYKPKKDEATVPIIDEEGNLRRVKVDRPTQVRIAKDVSESVSNAAQTLISSDRIEEAKLLMKRYGNQIDPVNQAKLKESLEEAEIDNSALRKLNELENLPTEQQRQRLRAMPTRTAKDASIKQQALKHLDTNVRLKENLRRRDSQRIYDQLMNQILDRSDPNRTQKKQMLTTTLQLENSTFDVDGRQVKFKDVVDRVTDSSQRKALYNAVKDRTDKGGDQQAYMGLLDDASNGVMDNMSFSEFERRATTLNKKQYNRAYRAWYRLNIDTDSKERTRVHTLLTRVEELAASKEYGLLKPGRFTKYNRKSTDRLLQLRDKAIDYLGNRVHQGMTYQELNETARQFVEEQAKQMEEQDTGLYDWLTGVFDDDTPADQPVPGDTEFPDAIPGSVEKIEKEVNEAPKGTGVDFFELPESKQLELWKQYELEHEGEPPESQEELANWYKEKQQEEVIND